MRVVTSKPLTVKKGDIVYAGKDFKVDQGDLSLLGIGEQLVLNDGELILTVLSVKSNILKCKCNNNATIKENMVCYNKTIYDTLDFVSKKDSLNILDAIKYNAHYIAISHVRNKDNIEFVKKYIKKINKDYNFKIISKIENEEAIKNLDEILEKSDGIMIARGDLGRTLPIEKLAEYQKIISNKGEHTFTR